MPDPIDVHVGSKIRNFRTLKGLSQEQLGKEIGLTFQQIQKYERGTNRIGASRLVKIAKVLGVRAAQFFEDIPEAFNAYGRKGMAENAPLFESKYGFAKRETLEFVRCFNTIESKKIRNAFETLVLTIYEEQAGTTPKKDEAAKEPAK